MTQALIGHVEESIAKAWDHESRMMSIVGGICGRTSPKIRHLLNNLCGLPDTVFLEVGSWRGASFVAALSGNEKTVTAAYAIDNWKLRGSPLDKYNTNEQMFDDETSRFLSGYGNRWQKIKSDMFDVKSLPLEPTIFYYDADHGQTENGTRHFFQFITDPCIVCLDDWSWEFVQIGWRDACKHEHKTVIKEWKLPAKKAKDIDLWWEGFYVCILTGEG